MKRYAEIVPLGVLLAMIVLAIFYYPQLPARIVTHFGPSGRPDGWMEKFWGLAISPIVGFFLYLLLSFLPRLATHHDRENVSNLNTLLYWLKTILLVLFLAIQWIQISVSLGYRRTLDFALFAPLLSAVLFVSGYATYRARRNYFVGFRLPWTLADDEIWDRTNRPAGIGLMVISIIVLPFFLMSPAWAFAVMIVTLLLEMLVFTVYAYVIYRKKHPHPQTWA